MEDPAEESVTALITDIAIACLGHVFVHQGCMVASAIYVSTMIYEENTA